MLEQHLQKIIETMYRIEGTLSVADFRVGGTFLEILFGNGATVSKRESLIVRHDGEYTDVALYIDDEIRARAHAFLEDRGVDIDAFCAATEGVSHFVYFTFCGEQLDRPVSQIELELQAEIDKFLVLRLFGPEENDLVSRLFEQIRLADHLSPDEQERYLVANRVGRRYARWLDRQIARGRAHDAIQDARHLYRKPLAAKLDHIARAA